MATIYDNGFDKYLHRAATPQTELDMPTASAIFSPSAPIASSQVSAGSIAAGEVGDTLFYNKKSFTDTANGFRQGLDTDGVYKWIIGGASSSVDWAVTTANTLTINGSLVAGGAGGWTITASTLYDLTSGTPTAAPNNGVVLDSGNAAVIVYEGTAERVRVGYLSAAVYGIRGYATNGTTTIFELSDTQQFIAGWTFTDTTLSSVSGGNTTTISSGATSFLSGPTGAPTTSITQAGVLTTTSASIAAFTIAATTISATNLVLTSGVANTANITVGTGATAGGINSANAAGDIIFWGGSTFANRATANFRVQADGVVYATTIIQAVITVPNTQNNVALVMTQSDTTNNPVLCTGTQNGTGDILNLFDGATEVFTILDGGAIGINNAAPTARVDIISTGTTTHGLNVVASSLTTGSAGRFYSNGTDVSVRNLVEIVNDNPLATGARCLFIDQDADVNYIRVDSENTTSSGFYAECDVLTSGNVANFNSSSTDITARTLVTIGNLSALATGARCLSLDQDANAVGLYVDTEMTSSYGVHVECDTITSGTVFRADNANALTSGGFAYWVSNSTSTTARNLVEYINDNTAANRATVLRTQQDAHWIGAELDGFISADDPMMETFARFTGHVNDGLTATPGTGTISRALAITAYTGTGTKTLTSTGVKPPNNTWDDTYIVVFPHVSFSQSLNQDAFWGLANSGSGTFSTTNVPDTGTDTTRHIGFFLTEGTVYASNANGTTQTRTDVSASADETVETTYAIWWRSATDIVFLSRARTASTWTVLATHTTNLPSGTTDAPQVFIGHEMDVGSGTMQFGNNYTVAVL